MCNHKIISTVKKLMLSNNFKKQFAENGASSNLKNKSPNQVLIEKGLKKIVDLTHTLTSDFPTYSNKDSFEMNRIGEFEKDGYNGFQLQAFEHVGTHIDAPLHFSKDGNSVDEIPVENLIVPLVLINIKSQTLANEDYLLTIKDIENWKAANGNLPNNCCIAVNSGWDKFTKGKKFRNEDENGIMHFPSFGIEAINYILEETTAVGIAVDTMSIDIGKSEDFPVHKKWLSQNKWGLEAVKNFDLLPAKGAYLFVGAPKHKGGSGGQCRVIALF